MNTVLDPPAPQEDIDERVIVRRSPRLAGRNRLSAPTPVPQVDQWHQMSNCVGLDLAIFYGTDDNRPMTRRELKAARQVCRECPVRRSCLAEALLTDDPWGIWGGFTRPERSRIVEYFAPPSVLQLLLRPDDAVTTHYETPSAAGAAALIGALSALDAGELEDRVIVL